MTAKQELYYTTQPYFVMESKDFRQTIARKDGISHFYSCSIRKGQLLRIVPDGCIDLIFSYKNDRLLRANAIGTRLSCEKTTAEEDSTLFGLRFLPGIQPPFLKVTMRALLSRTVSLADAMTQEDSRRLLGAMGGAGDYESRIRTFLHFLEQEGQEKPEPYGKDATVRAVKKMAYESGGRIRIHTIAQNTGYSERYIHRIFMEEMGFSPKTFCKIIQFQRALQFLNYGAPDKMTNAAVMLGYYDQPQFIRDFTRYAGITPKQYLKLVEKKSYRSILRSTQYLPGTESVPVGSFPTQKGTEYL